MDEPNPALSSGPMVTLDGVVAGTVVVAAETTGRWLTRNRA
jgi:hypothetical protein